MMSNQQKRILIIDDDAHILSGLGDFLKFKGFAVELAESGEEGLTKLASATPDIILLDINMPGMGGMGFLRRILRRDGSLSCPVIVFTARAALQDFFDDVAVDGFIAKPCDEIELLDKIRDTLEKHAPRPKPIILMGEDEPLVAERLRREFIHANFAVEQAQTGPEVLEKAATCLPQAVVIKRVMTGLNGDAVAALLHEMPHTRNIPVVLYEPGGVASAWNPSNILPPPNRVARYLATADAVTLRHAVEDLLTRSV